MGHYCFQCKTTRSLLCMQESGKKVTNMQLLIEGFRDDYTWSSDNQELHKECKLIWPSIAAWSELTNEKSPFRPKDSGKIYNWRPPDFDLITKTFTKRLITNKRSKLFSKLPALVTGINCWSQNWLRPQPFARLLNNPTIQRLGFPSGERIWLWLKHFLFFMQLYLVIWTQV